jgi:hypothetical protein
LFYQFLHSISRHLPVALNREYLTRVACKPAKQVEGGNPVRNGNSRSPTRVFADRPQKAHTAVKTTCIPFDPR